MSLSTNIRKSSLPPRLTPHRLAAAAMAIIVVGLMTTCAPRIHNRGNLISPEILDEIEVGATDRREVRRILGPPSSIGNFGDKNWIYVGVKSSQSAFLPEQTISRKVIAIAFDDDDRVAAITKLTEENGASFAFSTRKTPTAGQEITLLQQLVGNLGRFNSGGREP